MFRDCKLKSPIDMPAISLDELIDWQKDIFIFGDEFDDFEVTCSDGTYTISIDMLERPYSLYGTKVYYHGTYGSHEETDIVIGEVTSSDEDLADGVVTVRFNGDDAINGFSEEVTFYIDLDNSRNLNEPTVGNVSGVNENELGCLNFYEFNDEGDDIWIQLPIQEN